MLEYIASAAKPPTRHIFNLLKIMKTLTRKKTKHQTYINHERMVMIEKLSKIENGDAC